MGAYWCAEVFGGHIIGGFKTTAGDQHAAGGANRVLLTLVFNSQAGDAGAFGDETGGWGGDANVNAVAQIGLE